MHNRLIKSPAFFCGTAEVIQIENAKGRCRRNSTEERDGLVASHSTRSPTPPKPPSNRHHLWRVLLKPFPRTTWISTTVSISLSRHLRKNPAFGPQIFKPRLSAIADPRSPHPKVSVWFFIGWLVGWVPGPGRTADLNLPRKDPLAARTHRPYAGDLITHAGTRGNNLG